LLHLVDSQDVGQPNRGVSRCEFHVGADKRSFQSYGNTFQRLLERLLCYFLGTAWTLGYQRRLVYDIGNLSRRIVLRELGHFLEIDIDIAQDLAQVIAEERRAFRRIRQLEVNASVHATGAHKGWIENAIVIGGTNNENVATREAVHFSEQRIQ